MALCAPWHCPATFEERLLNWEGALALLADIATLTAMSRESPISTEGFQALAQLARRTEGEVRALHVFFLQTCSIWRRGLPDDPPIE
jgi:hypothetical protein